MPLGDGSAWDETTPVDATLVSQIDDYDRDLRIGVRGRMALEHEWPSSQAATAQAGVHRFVTLQNQAAKPTVSGTQIAAIYTKTVGGGLQELFFENEAGTEVQLTNRSILNANTGGLLQMVSTFISTSATGITAMTYDDSKPQITEGDSYLSKTITPLTATSVIKGEALVYGNPSGNSIWMAACFLGTTADALGAGIRSNATDYNCAQPLPVKFTFVSGTTGTITIFLRAGCANGGTLTINGDGAARKLGGVLYTSIILEEFKG